MFPPYEPLRIDHLDIGGRYEVVVPFTDYDGCIHPEGEVWTYFSNSFLPYEDGLTLSVRDDDGREWGLRLQWKPEAQAEIIEHFDRYVRRLPGLD